MRTIKFRAWDRRHQKMLDDAVRVGEILYWDSGECFTAITEFDTDPPRHEIMQFTGILDKNGKEIYEGDVLFDGTDAYDAVVYRGNSFILEPLGDDCVCWDQCEVVGNIYENSELLSLADAR